MDSLDDAVEPISSIVLDLDGAFTGAEVLSAMEGHVLDQATQIGTYSMNPSLRDAA